MEYIIIALLVILIILNIVLIINKNNKNEINKLIEKQNLTDKAISDGFMQNNNNLNSALSENRKELANAMNTISDSLEKMNVQNLKQQINVVDTINTNLKTIMQTSADEAERHSRKLDGAIKTMQENNEKKLDEMRQTVDEKLTSTLTTRLNSSFKTVSDQLENVYKSLGEMKELSGGVTSNVQSLSKILTNVKTRGTWAEVQLENILDQTIPMMYEKNFSPSTKSREVVEFAVKIPTSDGSEITYLPIDSKFPMEDYIRLTSAAEAGDLKALEQARKALEDRVKDEAKQVKKYINPPVTTPFAILYLATEGLYAEISSSKSGISELLQNEYNIMIAGPTTITALLNSLSMGFKTMAINQRANEVWEVLGIAKKQYDKFGELLETAKKKVNEAGKALDNAQFRNEQIQKKLKKVEVLEETSDDILEIKE